MATDTVAATGSITNPEPRRRRNTRAVIIGGAAIVLTGIFFVVPFIFIFLIASKELTEANALEF